MLLNEESYEIISGQMPKEYNELVLVLNEKNEVPLSVMYSLNIENINDVSKFMAMASNGEKTKLSDVFYDYDKIIGKTYKAVSGADLYTLENGVWVNKEENDSYLKQVYDNAENLKVVGIVKVKDENTSSGFLGYTDKLITNIINKANQTQIAKAQLANSNINVFTGEKFDEVNDTYTKNLELLSAGDLDTPNVINIYPKYSDSKNKIKQFIDNYNTNVNEDDKIMYVDEMQELTNGITKIVNLISMVMIAFVAISLVVSSLMIGIITYISVLERTKEIGILRAIGASKKDVKRVFVAETIIEGFASGSLGIVVTYLLSLLVNVVVKILAKIDSIIVISPVHAIILIAISVMLTVIAGLGPARIASKKDPVESLKNE